MKTVSIRQLSGEVIAHAAAEDTLLGITNAGALTGVLVPASRATLMRLAERGHGMLLREVDASNDELGDDLPLATLADALTEGTQPADRRPISRVTIRQVSG